LSPPRWCGWPRMKTLPDPRAGGQGRDRHRQQSRPPPCKRWWASAAACGPRSTPPSAPVFGYLRSGRRDAQGKGAEEEGADTLMELSAGGDLDRIRRAILANTRCRWAMCRSIRPSRKPRAQIPRTPAKLDPEYLFRPDRTAAGRRPEFHGHPLRHQPFTPSSGCASRASATAGWCPRAAPSWWPGWTPPARKPALRAVRPGLRADEEIRRHPVAGQRHPGRGDPRQPRPGPDGGDDHQLRTGRTRPGDGLPDDGGGPGHVPLDEIEGNIMLEKRMSGNAPYYVLGRCRWTRGRLRPYRRRHRRGQFGALRRRPDLLHHPGRAPGPAR
jgi:hypothetical protein